MVDLTLFCKGIYVLKELWSKKCSLYLEQKWIIGDFYLYIYASSYLQGEGINSSCMLCVEDLRIKVF